MYTGHMTHEIAKGAAEVIRQLMKAQDVNQSELARRTGVSRSYVSQSLDPSNSSAGSLNTMENYARAMGHTLISPKPIEADQPLPLYQSKHSVRSPKKGKEAKRKSHDAL